MKNTNPSLIASVCLGSLALLLPASAVIVAGANGGAGTTNNTTVGQLNTALGTTFPNFNNVIKYSDSSAIYLGYTYANKEVWVLSARHVTPTLPGSTLTIDGNSYTQQGSQQLVGGDLALIKYKNELDLIPSMPAITLASAVPTHNQQIVMIGWGVDRVEAPSTGTSDAVAVVGGNNTGYTWRANTPENQLLRWGTNNVDTTGIVANVGDYTTIGWNADFDQPGSGAWLTSNEASVALRDSGSGAFAFVGGTWRLVGTATATYAEGAESPFTAPSDFQGSLYTNISSYKPAIDAAIGAALVPEPSFGCLMALGGLGLLLIRRRA